MVANPSLDGTQSRRGQFIHLLLRARDRWRAYDVYLSALLIFAASRLVVVVGINLGKLLVRVPDPMKWDAGPAWYDRLLRWDTGWYASIVADGYRYSDDGSIPSSTVFYPLYPLAAYAVKSLFGVDHFMALLLVANVASLIVALLLTKFVRDELGDEIALWSLAFFCFFPSALFLSAGYSEALFLLFVLLSFILLVRQKFALAAALAGLSLATRSIGIVMIPVILWEMGHRSVLPWSRLLPRMAVCGALAASGLLAYLAYLGIEFGHPLAFATGQAAWHGGSFLDRFVSGLTLASFRHTNLRIAGWFVCFVILTIWSFGRLRSAVSLYGLGALALPYFTLGITDSMNRFVLVCFPALVCLGILCRGRPWLGNALVGIFAALLLQTAALFSQWYWVG
jgi:hypothetical protein